MLSKVKQSRQRNGDLRKNDVQNGLVAFLMVLASVWGVVQRKILGRAPAPLEYHPL